MQKGEGTSSILQERLGQRHRADKEASSGQFPCLAAIQTAVTESRRVGSYKVGYRGSRTHYCFGGYFLKKYLFHVSFSGPHLSKERKEKNILRNIIVPNGKQPNHTRPRTRNLPRQRPRLVHPIGARTEQSRQRANYDHIANYYRVVLVVFGPRLGLLGVDFGLLLGLASVLLELVVVFASIFFELLVVLAGILFELVVVAAGGLLELVVVLAGVCQIYQYTWRWRRALEDEAYSAAAPSTACPSPSPAS